VTDHEGNTADMNRNAKNCSAENYRCNVCVALNAILLVRITLFCMEWKNNCAQRR